MSQRKSNKYYILQVCVCSPSEIWQKSKLVFIRSTRYACQILMKLEFSQQILEKYTNMKFHKHPTIRSRVVPCGRMDRHDKTNSRFSKFFERAKKLVLFFSADVTFTLSRNINVNINIILYFLKSWQFMKFLDVTLDSGCGLQWKRIKSQGLWLYKKEIPTIRLNLFCTIILEINRRIKNVEKSISCARIEE